MVADVDLVFQHSLDGKVLPELSEGEICPKELPFPILVVLDRVRVGRLINSAVAQEVRLPVPVEVQCPEHDPSFDRPLEDSCRDRLTPVHDLRRWRNVYGEQFHPTILLPDNTRSAGLTLV